MTPIKTVSGVAAPFLEDNVDTDQIAPVQPRRQLKPDYAKVLFSNRRDDGELFLAKPEYQSPAILVVGDNFGCGSSRESAVWAIKAIGVRCVVARGIAHTYRENCIQNGVLPIVLDPELHAELGRKVVSEAGRRPFEVDLEQQVIRGPDGEVLSFSVADADRFRLLNGLDDIGLTLEHADKVRDWERRMARDNPYYQALTSA